MTAIHRREMLRVLLGGAVIATAELSMFPVPAEAALYCPANRVQNYSPELCPAAFATARSAGGAGDVESAAGAGSRRTAGSGFRPLSDDGAAVYPFPLHLGPEHQARLV